MDFTIRWYFQYHNHSLVLSITYNFKDLKCVSKYFLSRIDKMRRIRSGFELWIPLRIIWIKALNELEGSSHQIAVINHTLLNSISINILKSSLKNCVQTLSKILEEDLFELSRFHFRKYIFKIKRKMIKDQIKCYKKLSSFSWERYSTQFFVLWSFFCEF